MIVDATFSVFYGRTSVLGYMVTDKDEAPVHCPYVEIIYSPTVRVATVFVGNGQYDPLSCSITRSGKKDNFHSPFIESVISNVDTAFHRTVSDTSLTFVKVRKKSTKY